MTSPNITIPSGIWRHFTNTNSVNVDNTLHPRHHCTPDTPYPRISKMSQPPNPSIRILKCRCCSLHREEWHFHAVPENLTGRSGTCKDCRRIQMAQYNRERRAFVTQRKAELLATDESPSSNSYSFRDHIKKKQNWPVNPAKPLPAGRGQRVLKQNWPIQAQLTQVSNKPPIIAQHDRHSTSSPGSEQPAPAFTDIFNLPKR